LGNTEDLLVDPIQLQSQNIADRDPGTLDPNGFVLPRDDVEDLWLHDRIHLETLKTSADFVQALQDATLDDPTLGMSDEALHRLHNPLHEPPILGDKYT
jgi:hypothetical protein